MAVPTLVVEALLLVAAGRLVAAMFGAEQVVEMVDQALETKYQALAVEAVIQVVPVEVEAQTAAVLAGLVSPATVVVVVPLELAQHTLYQAVVVAARLMDMDSARVVRV